MKKGGRSGLGIFVLALGLYGCNGSDVDDGPVPPAQVLPAGGLVQRTLRGPILHTTAQGWRTEIDNGTVSIRPPEGSGGTMLQYVSRGMREALGTQDLRAWEGSRRSLLLPGGAKITLHGQGGQIIRLSIHDGAESHEVDVLTQTLLHSQVDAAVARRRDEAEHDGEAAHLLLAPGGTLHLANLYIQRADASGRPLREEVAARALGRQFPDAVHPYADPDPVFPVEISAQCDAIPQARGGLFQASANGPLDYVSRSGWWVVKIDQHTITVTRRVGVVASWTWQVWGDPHENLNGKHIKDWLGGRRTLLLDDGTRITMHADGPHHVVHTTSIHDGAQSHEIGNVGNQIRHSCVDQATAAQRDAREADGETAFLALLRAPASNTGSLYVENIYVETEDAAGTQRSFEVVPLGETGDAEVNPNQVNDYYDDPRLGHT